MLLALIPAFVGASLFVSADDGDTEVNEVINDTGDISDEIEDAYTDTTTSYETTIQGETVSEDTTVTLTQDEISGLVETINNGGEVPEFLLQDGANMTIEVEGDIDGYLHLAEYTEATHYTGHQTSTDHVALIWSDSPDMPELDNTYFRDGDEISSDDITGGNGTIIMDLSVYSYQTPYNGEVSYEVTEAGKFTINDSQVETTNTDLGEHIFEADHHYVDVGEVVIDADGENSYYTPIGTSVENEQHLEIIVNEQYLETLDGAIPTYDLTSDYSSDETFSDITVSLETPPGSFVHEIYYANDSDSMMILVVSDSPEVPDFEADWYGNVYFSDSTLQPVAAFKVSDMNSPYEEGTVTTLQT
jgi:hypothetical protein